MKKVSEFTESLGLKGLFGGGPSKNKVVKHPDFVTSEFLTRVDRGVVKTYRTIYGDALATRGLVLSHARQERIDHIKKNYNGHSHEEGIRMLCEYVYDLIFDIEEICYETFVKEPHKLNERYLDMRDMIDFSSLLKQYLYRILAMPEKIMIYDIFVDHDKKFTHNLPKLGEGHKYLVVMDSMHDIPFIISSRQFFDKSMLGEDFNHYNKEFHAYERLKDRIKEKNSENDITSGEIPKGITPNLDAIEGNYFSFFSSNISYSKKTRRPKKITFTWQK